MGRANTKSDTGYEVTLSPCGFLMLKISLHASILYWESQQLMHNNLHIVLISKYKIHVLFSEYACAFTWSVSNLTS